MLGFKQIKGLIIQEKKSFLFVEGFVSSIADTEQEDVVSADDHGEDVVTLKGPGDEDNMPWD